MTRTALFPLASLGYPVIIQCSTKLITETQSPYSYISKVPWIFKSFKRIDLPDKHFEVEELFKCDLKYIKSPDHI